jgi:hypothetical protein
MCVEVFRMYNCGCRESIDILACPFLDQIERLVLLEDVSEDSYRVIELHEKCKEKRAERFSWLKADCDSCLEGGGTAKAMAKLVLEELYDADDGDNDDGGGSGGRTPKGKGREVEIIEDQVEGELGADQSEEQTISKGEDGDDEEMSDDSDEGGEEEGEGDEDYSDSSSDSDLSSSSSSTWSSERHPVPTLRRRAPTLVAPTLETIYEEYSSSASYSPSSSSGSSTIKAPKQMPEIAYGEDHNAGPSVRG